MDSMKKEATRLALVNLFKGTSFNICTIDNLMKLNNIIPDPEVYNMLKVLHCINYSEMHGAFRKDLFESVLQLFKSGGFDVDDIDDFYTYGEQESTTDGTKPRNFLRKLIS
jgi:hypothetical protein